MRGRSTLPAQARRAGAQGLTTRRDTAGRAEGGGAVDALTAFCECQGSDIIIATPYAFSGFHIAEAMGACSELAGRAGPPSFFAPQRTTDLTEAWRTRVVCVGWWWAFPTWG